ncbi:MAG TPA: response regulator transcription factor, partial [Burkholderiales bacterium]|nr:response regulator transcription factor [Burkholderiales bacterium]
MRKVLVIEDQQDIAEIIRLHLEDLSYKVKLEHDGLAGLADAEAHPYDLIILDLMLPGMDGLDICRRLRSKSVYTPILMLTAKVSEFDRVLGLELGADDYLTKPFSVLELVARTKALFRRMEALEAQKKQPAAEDIIECDGMKIDPVKREVTIDGARVSLTTKEYELLLHFARNPGRVYTRLQLLDAVWGYGFDGYEHNVNCHINRLRGKIERDPVRPRF